MNKELYYAYIVLKKVYLDGAYAGHELNKLINIKKHEINTALVTNIVYGVLEKDIYLDYVVGHFVKPNTKPAVLIILKIGAFVKENIASIPAFACVNELVEITKKYENRHAGGFVNATLKNIYKTKINLPKREDLVKHLSVLYSYPTWIIEALLKQHGLEFTEEYLKKQLTLLTHIRVLPEHRGEFLTALQKLNIQHHASCSLPYAYYVDYEKLLSQSDLAEQYAVQGLPSIITSLAVGVQGEAKVLDVCAAPGGKSVFMAQLEPKAQITANDIYQHKLQLIESYASKFKLTNVKTTLHDGATFNADWEDRFDYVLCDVPCSNTGIANKKPDVLLNKKPDQLPSLTKLQFSILENSAKYVKIGGTLVYSTCSILQQENADVVNKFLDKHKHFKLQPIDTFGIEVLNTNQMCSFYPHISQTEGFFIAKLKRVE